MDLLMRLYIRLRERRGQAMTEYALILAGLAVVAFFAYQLLGQKIANVVDKVSRLM